MISRRRKIKTTRTTKTSKTFKLFWIANDESGKPPLPPNKPYHWPLNYPEYVNNFNLDAHVRVFKVAIKANGETKDVKIVNMFSFTLKDTMFN